MSRILAPGLVLGFTLAAAVPALAAGGPQGRFGLDVEATKASMAAAGKTAPQLGTMLDQTKDLLFFEFSGDTVSFVTGPAMGNRVNGRCRWKLSGTAIAVDRCVDGTGSGPFSFTGSMTYDESSNAIAVVGANSPAPVVYRPR
ncbi:hypothetical protein [Zavarzinia aquatilis]|uniref:Uncharacterized protein n=1 Tax=Zavarzinia aquatilis TaxID=2211142 RepID=A0A317E7C4_9PROT|nr:hypothetical protein [Zavarzinia aquatilis]PWR21303.1 hypothetical protein DKG74_12720 [Zavarzinia aquatilis]